MYLNSFQRVVRGSGKENDWATNSEETSSDMEAVDQQFGLYLADLGLIE